jgi:xanthine dehydrogenase YagS FAD-binding subunit
MASGARAVAAQAFAGAKTTDQNGFKITLAERTLAGVLAETN